MAQGTSSRGFASMDAERQRQIASLGGRAAHAKGTAHEFTSEEARIAGRLGGLNSHKHRAQSEDQAPRQEDMDFTADLD
ncbi:MAG TPA: KGG domain-containing protein, partial [Patescibacteria group bacterium]|nr:KGG domain-containing protein [Patescibacteria group bacterium]